MTGVDESPEAADAVRRLARSGIEIVAFTEMGQLEPEGFDVVRSPASPAIEAAYAMLRSRHEVVSFFSSGPVDPEARPHRMVRGLTFIDAARAAGDEAAAASVTVAGRGSGRSLSAALAWLDGPDRPTAVVCSTGYVALALQAAASRLGVRVPEELERRIFAQHELPDFPATVTSVTWEDGCKVRFEDDAWLTIRFSGTEPVLRVFAEAETREAAAALASTITEHYGLGS